MACCPSRFARLPLALAALFLSNPGHAAPKCSTDAECQEHMFSLIDKLNASREMMTGKRHTLGALESLRSGILSGQRIELPSVQRQHLESGSPLVAEISVDAKHRPVSTNTTRHLQRVRTIAGESEVMIHTFLPLKKKPSQKEATPVALMVTVDKQSRLSIHNLEGDVLLDRFDLGHAEGRTITKLQLSPSQENHFVLTADDGGEMRVHNLKIMAKKERREDLEGGDANETAEGGHERQEREPTKDDDDRSGPKKKLLLISTNFSASFTVPPATEGEERLLTAMMPMDRGAQTYFVTGDSLGGVSVFFRNGTLKGRVVVTDDPGGIKGLQRGQGQTVLFFSTHVFGFFSTSQLDVQYPPCDGWEVPLHDVALDPSGGSRVILVLEDGDILVFSTTRGKSKACDLTLKFPHISQLPYKIQIYRGHVMGLPVSDSTDHNKELYFFNLAAMDAGYGSSSSKVVTLQASFKPKQPISFALHAGGSAGGSGSGGGGGAHSRALLALKMQGSNGIELYELALKQPPAPKAGGGGGGGGGGSSGGGDSGSWLNWFPKIGVFGIALIGVVIWNVRKVTAQKRHDKLDDFDEEYFKEKLRERKNRKKEETAAMDDADKPRVEEVKDDMKESE